MSDAEAVAEGLVLGDHAVEGFHLTHQGLEPRIVEAGAVLTEAVGVEGGAQFHEGKAAAQRVVEHREAAVRRVHHADDVDVCRHAEQLVGVEELEFVSALIALDEHEQLTKNLGEVTAVDLINDEEVVVLLIVCGLLTEGVEGSLDQLESLAGRTIPLDEVLVGVALVELNQHDARNILDAHHRVGQALGSVGLADARRALHDDVLLGAQQANDRVVSLSVHVDGRQEVIGRIFGAHRRRLLDVHRVVTVQKGGLNPFHEFLVVGNIGERLHCELLIASPASLTLPRYLA